MKLDQLISTAAVDGVCCDDEDDDEPTTLEEDLSEALDLLDQCQRFMEDIKIRRGRIVAIPESMQDLLEDVEEFMDQWQGYNGDEKD